MTTTTRISNPIRGVIKIFALVVMSATKTTFAARVEELVADRPEVEVVWGRCWPRGAIGEVKSAPSTSN